MNHLDQWLQRIGEFLGITAVILGPLWAYTRSKLGALDSLGVDVALLAAENRNNSGHSMRDIAERTERVVTGLAAKHDDLAQDVARLTGRFDEFTRTKRERA